MNTDKLQNDLGKSPQCHIGSITVQSNVIGGPDLESQSINAVKSRVTHLGSDKPVTQAEIDRSIANVRRAMTQMAITKSGSGMQKYGR